MGKLSVFSLSLTALVIILGFQNCAGPVEGTLDPLASAKAQRNSDAPFAYDITVNRLAYMSCVNGPRDFDRQQLQRPVYFTFKVAAADDIGGTGRAGVKLSQQFVEFAENELPKKSDGKGGFSVTRSSVQNLVAESSRNQNARIQLAIRPVEKPSARLQSSEIEEQNFTFIMPALTEELVLDQIVDLKQGDRLNYIDGGKGLAGRDFEGQIGFFDSEDQQNELRGDLANRKESMLMLTVSESPGAAQGGEVSPQQARALLAHGDGGDENTVYGTGFQPTFAQADSRNPNNLNHVLRSVNEFDLRLPIKDRSPTAEWVCDTALRYMIFSPEDAEDTSLPVNCPKIPDPLTSTNPKILAEMEMLRSVLKPEHWFINIPGKCIVPKVGDCYPKDIPVQYETSLECGPGTSQDCAHFLSICYRASND